MQVIKILKYYVVRQTFINYFNKHTGLIKQILLIRKGTVMTNKVLIYFFAISLLMLNIKTIFAQDDNPLLDQPPKQYWDHISTVTPKAVTVITDNSGYDNFDLGNDFAECHISENPRNPAWYFIAYNTNGTYYTLNGIDWIRNNPSFPNTAGDPITAYDSLGNLFYDNMKSPITGTWNIHSTNNGVTWSTGVSANIGNDKNWIAADQTGGPFANYVYGTMTPGNFVRSIDHGASFTNTFSSSNTLPGMMVCVGPDVPGGNVSGGCVYVVTNTGSSFAATYTFFRSTNGGQSFDVMSGQNFANYVGTNIAGRNSVENMRTRPYPFISADNSFGPFRGRLYLVYSSNTPVGDGNKPDIFCRYSTDQGVTWSAQTKINDDPNSEANHQWMPAQWCDKETGKLYVQWMDTRDCPTSDSALIYASYSTDGGVTFVSNKQISNKKMKINCTTCGGGGTPTYLGDYSSIVSNSKTSMVAWTDFRNGGFGSYVAYFPDYAVRSGISSVNINSGQNVSFSVSVPSVKLYTGSIRFTASLDSVPASGTLNVSIVGRDSITSYPDSVMVRVEAVGSVTPGRYRVKVLAQGPNGTPVHRRTVEVLVNASYLNVGTNRPGIAQFKINGITYTQTQQLIIPNGTNVTVQAVSPRVLGINQYVFTNWSNGGDTTQTITINSNTTLTAFYKIQYKLTLTSSQGNSFGGNVFYDSASNANFGVLSRRVVNGGTTYYFIGWIGTGIGSYTSTDSLGHDTSVTVTMGIPLTEIARWSTIPVGINQISTILPDKYNLYQNYPNPFNPTTNIKFDVIKNGNVKIIIYNTIGEEVETLLNEEVQPGSYKVDFNGDNLSSGIYYYKIVTNDFSDVKKMLLIK